MTALDDAIERSNQRDQWVRLLEHQRVIRNNGWRITSDGYCVNINTSASKAHTDLDTRIHKQHPTINGDCIIHGWPQPCGPCHT